MKFLENFIILKVIMNTAIETIWQDFHSELKGFVVSKVGNTNDADDILQDAFLKIIQNMDKVKEADQLRQYLYGIVRNTTIDHFRAREKNKKIMEGQALFTGAEAQNLNRAIAESCVKPFINQLPEKYKEALLITEFQNVSQKELAARLDISHSGAKSRVQRGREKLKKLILDCCDLKSDAYGNLSDDEGGDCIC